MDCRPNPPRSQSGCEKSQAQGFRRVTATDPCPVCGKRDWCLRTEDDSAAICPRTSDGALRQCGAAGWLHRLGPRTDGRSSRIRSLTVPLMTSEDQAAWRDLADRYRAAVDRAALDRLAGLLGVGAAPLRRLGVGWCGPSRAWAFPMVDAADRIRGIRLRTSEGAKFAVRGGHQGLFIPEGLEALDRPLLICEGPTDTAALLDLGFAAVGRPSCSGGEWLVRDLVRRDRPERVAIVADGDVPGRLGAEALAGLLALQSSIRIISPPDGVKDARAWVRSGATRADIEAAIEAAPALKLTIRVTVRPPARPGRRRHGR